MPGLSYSNQSQSGRPGNWIIPVVLIVLSVLIITVGVRMDGGGVYGKARSIVQSVTKPIENVCSVISTPFKQIGTAASSEEVEALRQENEQLRTLVAQLEEYRQQDQRLTTLLQLSDTYGLETLSAKVQGIDVGWNQVSTINKGSDDGVQVGMGVISTCGLYGQVESVTSHSATVRRISDAASSVSVLIQGSRETGILSGSYDGNLTLEYVSVDSTVGEGDIIITSGKGGAYPSGIVVGRVKNVEIDPSKLYYRISVDPIYNIAKCQEVLVLTGEETETASILDEDAIKAIISAAYTESSAESQIEELTEGSTDASTQASTEASIDASTSEQQDADDEGESTKASSGFSSDPDEEEEG